MKPSWLPVWQHIAAAHGIVLGMAFAGVSPIMFALVNAIFWLAREFAQAVYREKVLDPRQWTRRTQHEWIMPSIVGASIAIGASMSGLFDLIRGLL